MRNSGELSFIVSIQLVSLASRESADYTLGFCRSIEVSIQLDSLASRESHVRYPEQCERISVSIQLVSLASREKTRRTAPYKRSTRFPFNWFP